MYADISSVIRLALLWLFHRLPFHHKVVIPYIYVVQRQVFHQIEVISPLIRNSYIALVTWAAVIFCFSKAILMSVLLQT